MASRMNQAMDRTKDLKKKPLPDFDADKRKSPKEKSPLQKVKDDMQRAKISQYTEQARRQNLGTSYQIMQQQKDEQAKPIPQKTTKYDGTHPSELMQNTEDKFARRAARMDSPSKTAIKSPLASDRSFPKRAGPEKSRDTKDLEARLSAMASQDSSRGGASSGGDALMRRYDSISQREDDVPSPQRQREKEEKEARLLSRAITDEGEATPGAPVAAHREEEVPQRRPKSSSAAAAQSTLTLVMVSLLPLLLYGCYRVVVQNIDPVQAIQIEIFMAGIETQILALFGAIFDHARRFGTGIGMIEEPTPKGIWRL